MKKISLKTLWRLNIFLAIVSVFAFTGILNLSMTFSSDASEMQKVTGMINKIQNIGRLRLFAAENTEITAKADQAYSKALLSGSVVIACIAFAFILNASFLSNLKKEIETGRVIPSEKQDG